MRKIYIKDQINKIKTFVWSKGVGFTKPPYTKMYLKYCLKIIGDC